MTLINNKSRRFNNSVVETEACLMIIESCSQILVDLLIISSYNLLWNKRILYTLLGDLCINTKRFYMENYYDV